MYIFVPCLRIAGGTDSNRAPRGRRLGGEVVRLACVSGMRALSDASTRQGSDLAGQILCLLEQARCVWGLGDGCCGGKWGDFRDPVGQL